jgi:hypothetical protein
MTPSSQTRRSSSCTAACGRRPSRPGSLPRPGLRGRLHASSRTANGSSSASTAPTAATRPRSSPARSTGSCRRSRSWSVRTGRRLSGKCRATKWTTRSPRRWSASRFSSSPAILPAGTPSSTPGARPTATSSSTSTRTNDGGRLPRATASRPRPRGRSLTRRQPGARPTRRPLRREADAVRADRDEGSRRQPAEDRRSGRVVHCLRPSDVARGQLAHARGAHCVHLMGGREVCESRCSGAFTTNAAAASERGAR